MDVHPDCYMEYGVGPIAIDMSTAILRMYTPKGFVIAADGRSTNSSRGLCGAGEATQKIFDILGGGHHIACTLSGAVQISPNPDIKPVFDFSQEVILTSRDLSSRKCQNLFGYAIRLSRAVNRSLSKIRMAGLIEEFPTGPPCDLAPGASVIAIVFLDAFYNKTPQRACIIFRHRDQALLEPDVVSEPATIGARFVLGVAEITRLFFDTPDPRFAAYRRPPHRFPPSMADIGELFKNYILAYADPEVIKIDPRQCLIIGGHIHIANITPEGGFHWQIPPLA